MKYKKKPVTIEAIQYQGFVNPNSFFEIKEFVGTALIPYILDPETMSLGILTLEGVMRISPGDYVIKGVKGEFYPCKPDIFEMTYEACCKECNGTVNCHDQYCARAYDNVESDEE